MATILIWFNLEPCAKILKFNNSLEDESEDELDNQSCDLSADQSCDRSQRSGYNICYSYSILLQSLNIYSIASTTHPAIHPYIMFKINCESVSVSGGYYIIIRIRIDYIIRHTLFSPDGEIAHSLADLMHCIVINQIKARINELQA